MSEDKTKQEKLNLHPRNRNRRRYDLKAMIKAHPALEKYVLTNKQGNYSIDFSDPAAVKSLNHAILRHYYGIDYWEFPDENLCPPIPGRAEYIHLVADLLAENNKGEVPTGKAVTCLDIGIGASCIYPIIGVTEYQWDFIGSDINLASIRSSQQIVNSNPALQGKIQCRLQKQPKDILRGILGTEDKIDMVICNPPFHESMEEAMKGSKRKMKNLSGKNKNRSKLNFSGNSHELVYEGGELAFIRNLISESIEFSKSCFWFSILVSKDSNVKSINKYLQAVKPSEIKKINIKTGNKTSRIIAWTFLKQKEKEQWQKDKWVDESQT